MRRWVWIAGIIAVVVVAYWAWPLASAASFAAAVQRGDPNEITEWIDIPALRRSLARQIATAYLDVTGRGKKMGSLGRSFAGAAVTTVADPYVAELLTPENIAMLLKQGKVKQVKVGDQVMTTGRDLPPMSDLFHSGGLSILVGSYFDGIASFVIPATLASAPEDEYRIHLRLGGIRWRLSGLDLPPALVNDMARSIMAGDTSPPP